MESVDFINRIDELLKIKNIKRIAMCEAVGITSTSMTDWKRRNSIPAADTTYKIAQFLGVTVEYLLTGNERKTHDFVINDNEKKLLSIWRNIPEERQIQAIEILKTFEK